jgi:hypothetical protein
MAPLAPRYLLSEVYGPSCLPYGVHAQVAGLNYRAAVLVNGDIAAIVTAFKPLPHTGLPLEVKSAERGAEL